MHLGLTGLLSIGPKEALSLVINQIKSHIFFKYKTMMVSSI